MPAPRAAAFAVAAFLALPGTASADPLAPTAQCTYADTYKSIPFGGVAYTTGSVVPRRITLICQYDNGHDRHIARQTVEGAFVAVAGVGAASVPDSGRMCTTAVAEYVGGYVATTQHCRFVGET